MKVSLLLVLTLFLSLNGVTQTKDGTVFHLAQLGEQGVLLDKGWKFNAGDNMEWAKAAYNDSHWQAIDPTQDIRNLPQLWQTNIGWFRLHLSVDSFLRNQTLALVIYQMGASEIYLNGRLIHRLGWVSSNNDKVQPYNPLGQPLSFKSTESPEQVLAVRYSLSHSIPYIAYTGIKNPCLTVRINNIDQALANIHRVERLIVSPFLDYFKGGLFFILALLHLFFFWFYPIQRANLHFCIFSFASGLVYILYKMGFFHIHHVEHRMYLLIVISILNLLSNLFLLTAIYTLFQVPKGTVYRLFLLFFFICIPLLFWPYHRGYIGGWILFPFAVFLESFRITIQAVISKKRGAKIIAYGAIGFLVLYPFFTLSWWGVLPYHWIFGYLIYNLAVLSLPLSISLFLALEFAFTSRTLEAKLIEVQQLSEKTLAQEQEKQQLLATENERLEQQVRERTAEVIAQKEAIIQQNEEIAAQRDHVEQAFQELQATQAQLIQREKMASLGELTAGIAHEIQNPLNFVNNFSEVSEELCTELEEEAKAGNTEEVLSITADLKQNLEKIYHHGKRADSIVKGMLQHSRASSGEKQLSDINALVDEYIRLAYHGLRAKEKDFTASLITDFDASMGKVEVVPQELGRVLLNLFNNAFYAVAQKKVLLNGQYQPEVQVNTKAVGDKVEIRVKDNGTGIPESTRSKIFQPFFTTKPTGEGTGLGLSLSYDIITKGHGGELKVDSKEREGSEFIIILPNHHFQRID